MGADFFFRMGSTHQICQDYATAGEANGLIYAALSDGCSSSPDTDFGARFMVRAFIENIDPIPNELKIARTAARMAAGTGLSPRCLDATLLMAIANESTIEVFRAGDGVIAQRYRNGNWAYNSIAFENNAPRYLSYLLSQAASEQHHALVSKVTVTRGLLIPGHPWRLTSIDYPLDASAPVDGWSTDRGEVDLVLLFSDGVESFLDAKHEEVPLTQILDEIIAFKNLSGQFLARRCARFLNKTCAERGWTHSDDFSVAGLYLGDGT
jgi:hypothetical protein